MTTSGNWMGDIENGTQETLNPCWRRSFELKGTASSSIIDWERGMIESHRESLQQGRPDEEHTSEFTMVGPTRHIPGARKLASMPAKVEHSTPYARIHRMNGH